MRGYLDVLAFYPCSCTCPHRCGRCRVVGLWFDHHWHYCRDCGACWSRLQPHFGHLPLELAS